MNNLLTAIKAFVLKSRPAYKDDLGNGKYDVKKLPEECLPENTVTAIQLNATSNRLKAEIENKIKDDGFVIDSSTPSSTKKFKITVDDSGTLSATEIA